MDYDLLVTIGHYEKDGKEKKVSRKMGELRTDKNGNFYIKADRLFLNPLIKGEPDGTTFISVFEKKPKDDAPPTTKPKQISTDEPFDDDIPF